MNLLEQYIEKVHSEEPHKFDWTDKPYTKVDITTNCHGNVKRVTDIFPSDMWREIKEKGYFMA